MTEAEAKTQLESMVASAEVPELADAEVDQLVTSAKRHDNAGLAPGVDGWVPTFNLAAAAAEGWRWKAAKVAGDYDFTIEDEGTDQSQVHRHCLQAAAAQQEEADKLERVFSMRAMASAMETMTAEEEDAEA
jgi:hypothetical protein